MDVFKQIQNASILSSSVLLSHHVPVKKCSISTVNLDSYHVQKSTINFLYQF